MRDRAEANSVIIVSLVPATLRGNSNGNGIEMVFGIGDWTFLHGILLGGPNSGV
jgi:hypothetical protein